VAAQSAPPRSRPLRKGGNYLRPHRYLGSLSLDEVCRAFLAALIITYARSLSARGPEIGKERRRNMKFSDVMGVDIRSLAHADLVLAINVSAAMFAWNILGMLMS
jgi:hypothetical protein